MEKEWRKIDGYDYDISNDGEVRNSRNWRLLKSNNSHGRYYRVWICHPIKEKCRAFLIHRLVAGAFCEKLTGNDIVHHIDGNTFNNRFDNLMWTTQKNNVRLAYLKINRKMPDRHGKNNPNYKNGKWCKKK